MLRKLQPSAAAVAASQALSQINQIMFHKMCKSHGPPPRRTRRAACFRVPPWVPAAQSLPRPASPLHAASGLPPRRARPAAPLREACLPAARTRPCLPGCPHAALPPRRARPCLPAAHGARPATPPRAACLPSARCLPPPRTPRAGMAGARKGS